MCPKRWYHFRCTWSTFDWWHSICLSCLLCTKAIIILVLMQYLRPFTLFLSLGKKHLFSILFNWKIWYCRRRIDIALKLRLLTIHLKNTFNIYIWKFPMHMPGQMLSSVKTFGIVNGINICNSLVLCQIILVRLALYCLLCSGSPVSWAWEGGSSQPCYLNL